MVISVDYSVKGNIYVAGPKLFGHKIGYWFHLGQGPFTDSLSVRHRSKTSGGAGNRTRVLRY